MEIYLVRHTTPNIEKGICYGQTDLDICDTFEEEVTVVLSNLGEIEHAKVYSSPLKRCVKLAKTISTNIIEDHRLKEIHFGDWELIKWDDINRADLDDWMNDYVNKKVPNGESCLELYQRNIEFFNEIVQLNHAKTVIVCHAGVIRSILAFVNNTPIEDSYNIKIDYGQVFKMTKTHNNYIIK